MSQGNSGGQHLCVHPLSFANGQEHQLNSSQASTVRTPQNTVVRLLLPLILQSDTKPQGEDREWSLSASLRLYDMVMEAHLESYEIAKTQEEARHIASLIEALGLLMEELKAEKKEVEAHIRGCEGSGRLDRDGLGREESSDDWRVESSAESTNESSDENSSHDGTESSGGSTVASTTRDENSFMECLDKSTENGKEENSDEKMGEPKAGTIKRAMRRAARAMIWCLGLLEEHTSRSSSLQPGA